MAGAGQNIYFKECRGLLFSDQVLFSGDRETRGIEMRVAFANSAAAMIKLGSLGVKSNRSNGESRQNCTAFNSH